MKMKQKITSALLALVLILASIPAFEVSAADVSGWKTASAGQRNAVRRAYQMSDIKWTPKKNVTGWKSEFTYKAGTTYTGLPYSQPTQAKFVPWKASFEDFLAAVADTSSKFYKTHSERGISVMPYYGTDCSSFVAYAWGLKSRGPVSSLYTHCTKISSSSYANARIGDALIRSSHAALITDITYDASGNVTSIEVCDGNAVKATNYCAQKIRFGKGGTRTLAQFNSKYFEKSYSIYRCNTIDNVTYTHSCAVPLEGDSCTKCGKTGTTTPTTPAPTTPAPTTPPAPTYKETACNFNVVVNESASTFAIPDAEGTIESILFSGTEAAAKAYHIDADGNVWYKLTDNTWIPAELVTPDCAHSFTGKVTKAATCAASGTKLHTCSKCMFSYTEMLAKLDHSYTCKQTKAPTCTKAGENTYTCTVCKMSYVDPVAAKNHTYVNGVCSSCGAVTTDDKADVDSDGVLTSDDAVYLLLSTMFGAANYPLNVDNADYNGDGLVNTDDAIYLLLSTMFGQAYYPLN